MTALRSSFNLPDKTPEALIIDWAALDHGIDGMNGLLLLTLLFCLAIGLSSQAVADDNETDANIVTALDISDSISRAELDDLVAALASAISSQPVVEAIRSGPTGRIGFSVFAWHHYRYSYVDWMLIASDDDAKEAASRIRRRLLARTEPRASEDGDRRPGRRTDISGAIDYAARLFGSAPYATQKRIVNIVGNGVDNVGEPAGPARDRFTRTGGTINGLVFGTDAAVTDYYLQQVIGGQGAFVSTIAGGSDLADAFRRKLLSDIALLQVQPITEQR